MDANPTSVTQSVAQTGEAQTLQTLNDQPQATAEIIETPVTVDSAASIKIKTEQPAKQVQGNIPRATTPDDANPAGESSEMRDSPMPDDAEGGGTIYVNTEDVPEAPPPKRKRGRPPKKRLPEVSSAPDTAKQCATSTPATRKSALRGPAGNGNPFETPNDNVKTQPSRWTPASRRVSGIPSPLLAGLATTDRDGGTATCACCDAAKKIMKDVFFEQARMEDDVWVVPKAAALELHRHFGGDSPAPAGAMLISVDKARAVADLLF